MVYICKTIISVSQAEPEIAEGTVRKVNKYTEVLCGAGISTGDDVGSFGFRCFWNTSCF
jgi:hypothetical protein